MHEMHTTLQVGTMIRGRYEVEEVLGKSEVGAVYLVRDRRNKQRLFVLREMSNPGWKYRYQFAFDSMFFKRPDHMALPHVYQVFNDGKLNRAFMLMDYIEGPNLETLREEQPERRFPLIQVISLIAPIMNAVTHLHSQRHAVIHGDIKPSNIIVRKEGGLPVLVGFSLVKEAATVTTLTFDGYRAPGYKAPEQYSGVTDPRTDIYALGGVLYTLLTGSVPAGVLYRARRLGEKEPDPLCPMDKIASDIPAGVTSAIHRAMSMHRSDRYSTVEQFWNALWQELIFNPMVEHTWEQVSIPSAEGNGESDADLMEVDATELVNISPTEEKREVDADPPLSPIAESVVATLAEETPIQLLDASPLWQQVTEPGIASSDPAHESCWLRYF